MYFVAAVLLMLAKPLFSDVVIELKLVYFTNPDGHTEKGVDCDPKSQCDMRFKVCVRAKFPLKSCVYDNTMQLSRKYPDQNNITFPEDERFLFRKNGSFGGTVGVFIEAVDEDSTSEQHVQNLTYIIGVGTFANRSVAKFINSTDRHLKRSLLKVAASAYCAPNFYGKTCDKYCDEAEGNYRCDTSGNKTCNDNWFGIDCRVHCVKSTTLHCNAITGERACVADHYGVNCTVYCKDTRNYTCSTTTGEKQCFEHLYASDCSVFCNATETYVCHNVTGEKLCLEHYHGQSCSVFCKASDKYICSANSGDKVCRQGWKGASCEQKESFWSSVGGIVSLLFIVLASIVIVCVIVLYLYKRNNRIGNKGRLVEKNEEMNSISKPEKLT